MKKPPTIEDKRNLLAEKIRSKMKEIEPLLKEATKLNLLVEISCTSEPLLKSCFVEINRIIEYPLKP